VERTGVTLISQAQEGLASTAVKRTSEAAAKPAARMNRSNVISNQCGWRLRSRGCA
jgi:hypothetical protein